MSDYPFFAPWKGEVPGNSTIRNFRRSDWGYVWNDLIRFPEKVLNVTNQHHKHALVISDLGDGLLVYAPVLVPPRTARKEERLVQIGDERRNGSLEVRIFLVVGYQVRANVLRV